MYSMDRREDRMVMGQRADMRASRIRVDGMGPIGRTNESSFVGESTQQTHSRQAKTLLLTMGTVSTGKTPRPTDRPTGRRVMVRGTTTIGHWTMMTRG